MSKEFCDGKTGSLKNERTLVVFFYDFHLISDILLSELYLYFATEIGFSIDFTCDHMLYSYIKYFSCTVQSFKVALRSYCLVVLD